VFTVRYGVVVGVGVSLLCGEVKAVENFIAKCSSTAFKLHFTTGILVG